MPANVAPLKSQTASLKPTPNCLCCFFNHCWSVSLSPNSSASLPVSRLLPLPVLPILWFARLLFQLPSLSTLILALPLAFSLTLSCFHYSLFTQLFCRHSQPGFVWKTELGWDLLPCERLCFSAGALALFGGGAGGVLCVQPPRHSQDLNKWQKKELTNTGILHFGSSVAHECRMRISNHA